jgi:DNA-binding transcriptional LysR family regulator
VLEVDRAGSISQAADNLYIGQPNLSKAIKELEQTLKITLFKRTSRGVQLTPKGREFLHYARGILRQYEEMEALGQDDGGEVQSLRVSVPRASYIVDAFTTLLSGLNENKSIQMDFFETNALRAIRHVSDGIFDLGVIRCKAEYQNYFTRLLEDSGLLWRHLLEFEYLLLISKDHPLAGRDIIDERELHPYIEIIHGDTAMPHMPDSVTETERGVTPGNKKVQVYERGSQFDILARVPGAYMWVSPMPQDLLDRNGLEQKRCAQCPKFIDMLIHQTGHTRSDLEARFVELLDESVENILSLNLPYQ